MARNKSTATAEAVEAEVPATEVEETATEAPATEAPATEAPAEETFDLSEFTAAVEQAFANQDTSTGVLAEADVDAVRAAYQALDGIKPKNAAKALLNEGVRDAVESSDMNRAKGYMILSEKAAIAAKGAPKKAVDPTEGYVNQRALVTLALFLQEKPEGVADDADERATNLANEAFATVGADEEHPLVAKARKIAQTKARAGGPRVTSGERRDLGAHIAEAFADKAEGEFLSVADIRKFKSSVYGDEQPSAGAITNRLGKKVGDDFDGSGCTVAGVKGAKVDGKIGGVKVAV